MRRKKGKIMQASKYLSKPFFADPVDIATTESSSYSIMSRAKAWTNFRGFKMGTEEHLLLITEKKKYIYIYDTQICLGFF